MIEDFLDLPTREKKPRKSGLTILIDAGLSTEHFMDVIKSHHNLIDFVKFGWGTSLVTQDLEHKIDGLRSFRIEYFFGGTLFEKTLSQKKLDHFYLYLQKYHCEYVEISNGAIELSNTEKCGYIKQFAREFKVFSEVGSKDTEKSERMYPERWISFIKEDLEAGAEKVIMESRENGQSGICRPNGELRFGLIEEIMNSAIDSGRLIFEAPNKYLQTYFIKRLGANANLANISFQDVVGLETLRLGLRADTLKLFDNLG